MNFKQVKLVGVLVLGLMFLVTLINIGNQVLATNDAGYYQVKQAAFLGHLTVRDEPGTYARLFGNITTYHISDMHYFSKDADSDSGPIEVQFADGSKADISGSIKFRLPTNDEKRLFLHREFKNFKAVKHDLVRQTVKEALVQAASLMRAEEMYTTRRGEFTALVEAQVKNGIYETVAREVKRKSTEDEEFIDKEVTLVRDANGQPRITKVSPFQTYGVEVVQFIIDGFKFDATIDALIAKKKETEQLKVVAVATAEKAKQDAITAQAQGQASIAVAKATQEVEKIKEVTIAQKEFEVAQLRRKQAEQDAAAATTRGKAEADVNRLKVVAGLTPLERATIDKETAIGVAAELSKLQFPSMMVIGGGSNGHAINPFDAVGLEAFHRLSERMSHGQPTRQAPARRETTRKQESEE